MNSKKGIGKKLEILYWLLGMEKPSWVKDFYPADLDSKYFLSYYSKVFNFVHVDMNDSPILPSSLTIQKWSEETPEIFDFL